MTASLPCEHRTDMASALGVRSDDRVCVVGSGGKSTLINALASCFSDIPVLCGTTTKIFPPSPETYLAFLDEETSANLLRAWESPANDTKKTPLRSGIYLAGKRVDHAQHPEQGDGAEPLPTHSASWGSQKPKAPSPMELKRFASAMTGQPDSALTTEEAEAAMAAFKLQGLTEDIYARLSSPAGPFSLLLLEADGSRMRPLKGWKSHEPVIPVWATNSIGVIPVRQVGKALNAEDVHRQKEFCALTGARMGKILTAEHLAAAISGPKGMFARARGRLTLLFSQVEDAAALNQAREVLQALPETFLQRLDRVAAGSALLGRAVRLR